MKKYLIDKILFDENTIKTKINELAEKINKDYVNEKLIIISILKGSFVFTADLIRKLNINCQLDFMIVSSYGNNIESNGEIKIIKDIDIDIKNKNVLILEDIVDTGITLNAVQEYFYNVKLVKTLNICTLLNKPCKREKNIDVKYFGFTIPDYFVVGYGIDYAEQYRELPYICSLKLNKKL